MDRKAPPNTYKALVLGISMVSILCLAAGPPLSSQSSEAVSTNLLWFLSIGIVSIVVAIGATVWVYEKKRVRSIQQQVAQKTEELKKSEEKYRSLVESAEDFIFTVDESGRFQSLKNFTANFFGGTPSQFIGNSKSVIF